MSEAAQVEPQEAGYDPDIGGDADRVTYRLRGPYFFGAAARLGSVLDSIADHPRAFVVDFADVPFIDSSGARSFKLLAHKVARKGGQLYLVGCRAEVKQALILQGADAPMVRFLSSLAAVDRAETER